MFFLRRETRELVTSDPQVTLTRAAEKIFSWKSGTIERPKKTTKVPKMAKLQQQGGGDEDEKPADLLAASAVIKGKPTQLKQ